MLVEHSPSNGLSGMCWRGFCTVYSGMRCDYLWGRDSSRERRGPCYSQESDAICRYVQGVSSDVLFSSWSKSSICLFWGCKTVCLKRLYRLHSFSAPRFRGWNQQDSHELLRYLIDGLRQEELDMIGHAINEHLRSKGLKSDDPRFQSTKRGLFESIKSRSICPFSLHELCKAGFGSSFRRLSHSNHLLFRVRAWVGLFWTFSGSFLVDS